MTEQRFDPTLKECKFVGMQKQAVECIGKAAATSLLALPKSLCE
jgi:hypothetical protein